MLTDNRLETPKPRPTESGAASTFLKSDRAVGAGTRGAPFWQMGAGSASATVNVRRWRASTPEFPAYKRADRSSRLRTFETCQRPPRAVRTPRSLRAPAKPRRSFTPACPQRIDDRQDVGRERIRFRRQCTMPGCRSLGCIAPIAQLGALSLPGRQRRPRALRDQPPLLLCQCSVEVQHEGICISPQFGDDEGHTLGHQARYEGHVAGEPIELGHNDRALLLPPCGQRCGQLRPSVEGVAPLPGFRPRRIRPIRSKPSAAAKRVTASRWASMPSPDRPCLAVDTR